MYHRVAFIGITVLSTVYPTILRSRAIWLWILDEFTNKAGRWSRVGLTWSRDTRRRQFCETPWRDDIFTHVIVSSPPFTNDSCSRGALDASEPFLIPPLITTNHTYWGSWFWQTAQRRGLNSMVLTAQTPTKRSQQFRRRSWSRRLMNSRRVSRRSGGTVPVWLHILNVLQIERPFYMRGRFLFPLGILRAFLSVRLLNHFLILDLP